MKTLKIAFAMGGGVSLGTFSGAALTECIKQLIIQGGMYDDDGKWESFENIELDVFSGASAGAMSLAIMLRILIAYEDKIHLLGQLDKYKDLAGEKPEVFKAKIREQLIKELDGQELDDKKMEQLIGVQVAQDFEQLLWCKRVDLEQLAGINKEGDILMKHTGSILDSNYLRELAKETLWPSDLLKVIENEHTVLNKRLLFVNSLTRVSARKITALPKDEEIKSFLKNKDGQTFYRKLIEETLEQGMSSQTHKDLRVFDLNLEPENKEVIAENNFPNRWVYSYNEEFDTSRNSKSEKPLFKLNDPEIWEMISSTSLAAGAFPIAFEPVKLKRLKHEIKAKEDKDYYYIDGGTFNNEPIREAFRLSGFLDDLDERSAKEYRRIVIYVDPFISDKTPFNTGAVYGNKHMYGGEKISNFIGPLVTILRQEGSTVEMDKTIGVLKKFDGMNLIRKFFNQTVQKGLRRDGYTDNEKKEIRKELKGLIAYVKKRLKHIQKEVTIPSNSLGFKDAIRKTIINESNQEYFLNKELTEGLSLSSFSFDDVDNHIAIDFKQFFKSNDEHDLFRAKYFLEWLTAAFFIALDATMDLSGKDQNSFVLPIGPISIDKKTKAITPIKLEGMPIEGFMGFVDERLRNYDFDIGKLVAKNVLAALSLIKDKNITAIPPSEKWDTDRLAKKGHAVIQKRIKKDGLLYYFIAQKKSKFLACFGNIYMSKCLLSLKKIKKMVKSLYGENKK